MNVYQGRSVGGGPGGPAPPHGVWGGAPPPPKIPPPTWGNQRKTSKYAKNIDLAGKNEANFGGGAPAIWGGAPKIFRRFAPIKLGAPPHVNSTLRP